MRNINLHSFLLAKTKCELNKNWCGTWIKIFMLRTKWGQSTHDHLLQNPWLFKLTIKLHLLKKFTFSHSCEISKLTFYCQFLFGKFWAIWEYGRNFALNLGLLWLANLKFILTAGISAQSGYSPHFTKLGLWLKGYG